MGLPEQFCASPYPDSLFILNRAVHPCVVDVTSVGLCLLGLVVSVLTCLPRLKHAAALKKQVREMDFHLRITSLVVERLPTQPYKQTLNYSDALLSSTSICGINAPYRLDSHDTSNIICAIPAGPAAEAWAAGDIRA
eukprot:873480-Pelagomonas_calceolata.AAC.9